MSLRARLAVLTSLAVALAIVAASVAAWLMIRSALLAEVDEQLLARVPDAGRIALLTAERPSDDAIRGDVRVLLQTDPIGVQLLDREGRVAREVAPGDVDLQLGEEERRLLDDGDATPHLQTVTVDGHSFRMVTVPTPDDGQGLLRLFQPLDGVESTLARVAWLLAAVAGAGVAAAGGLGWVTARAGLRPVDRLVAAAEQVAETKDLAHRIEVDGGNRDEVARLSAAMNAMLAALEQARAQQRELVENAAHELRTPLTTLRNDLGLLLRVEQHPERSLSAAERAGLLCDLEVEASALSDLVGEVVDLARGDVEPEPLLEADLRRLIERGVTRARRASPDVTVTVDGGELEAMVRPIALERAIANLVRNAVQVSPAGGCVEVTADEDEGEVVVQVLDRGPGITAEDLPRLFDRFYRGAGARERHGSGLGLAIVAQVADLHGGSVEAENRPGGGAVFTLRLPTAGPPSPTGS